jgi:hypothetical protein
VNYSGFRLQHEAAIAAVEKWTRVRHPGLVGVREAFTTRAFGDQCEEGVLSRPMASPGTKTHWIAYSTTQRSSLSTTSTPVRRRFTKRISLRPPRFRRTRGRHPSATTIPRQLEPPRPDMGEDLSLRSVVLAVLASEPEEE